METRWYLFPGQTLGNTRIQDRGHALHVTKNAWGKITAHLDRNRLIQEAIDKEKAHKRALKEGSEAMTQNWGNSVEVCMSLVVLKSELSHGLLYCRISASVKKKNARLVW